jgi:hypothetical protein
MRERLNNDPKVQLGVFAIAAVALGLILMIQLGGGGGSTSSSTTATTADPAATTPGATASPATTAGPTGTADTGTAGTATATGTDTATGTVTPSTSVPSTTAPPVATGTTAAMLPTKGLPSDVLVAYAKNKPVVLLVVDPHSRNAGRLKRYASQLDGYKDAQIFIVPTKEVAKYSRITEGVDVTQAPAIVVVTPRRLNTTAPTATVTYGVRSKKSFQQAIKDATYSGRNVPAYP